MRTGSTVTLVLAALSLLALAVYVLDLGIKTPPKLPKIQPMGLSVGD
ncbi:hypothetical protein KM176_12390 [Pseudooceanicola sp. CBS1P-1]|uniref:Uncharacterized protein n=1 Tax=Pseudooceanicola albus TaxID=2692189 RepID=A0A6L7G6R3_9RHOB|nr:MULTISPECIES: hypothetical protein [Pseudooceanicola]MBT9384662.1 hypothetical protein [Pseudooceanicola endophyticus]MXN18363.1 hypothetical protein [Pseudooceanicola albus]